jgi:hypothetical protein
VVGATCERNKVTSKALPMLNKEPYNERILEKGYIQLRIFLTLILASTIYALDYTSKETSVEATENEAKYSVASLMRANSHFP